MALFAVEKPPLVVGGAKLWVDAFQTPIGAVASWTDLSGYNNHPTQGTVGQQPINTANQLNGKNALVFTKASAQILTIPSGLYSIIGTTDYTMFVVAKNNSDAVVGNIIHFRDVGGVNSIGQVFTTTSGRVSAQSGAAVISVNSVIETNYNIYQSVRSGSTFTFSYNNGTASGTAAASDITPSGGAIGASNVATFNYLNGGIAEIIIYPYAHSAAQSAYINRYLANKWGIAIS